MRSEKLLRFTPSSKVSIHSEHKLEVLGKHEKCENEKDSNCRKKMPNLWNFLHVELTRAYELDNSEDRFSIRREKIYSFMKIPREVERFMLYGFMQCADAFLFVYTFLPMRVFLALWALVTRPFCRIGKNSPKCILTPAEICDLLKALILLVCSVIMMYLDTNMLYHLIKSQSIIKLYMFFNMLEIGDRLFSSFGQDAIDSLFWTATESRGRKREHLGTIPHLLFAIIYVVLHAVLVLFQATTINVAINSRNKALLTIMMSNNFVELKGSVFKKFNNNNLFQVSCSDVRERFHFCTLLFIVILQTMREYSWKSERFWVMLPDCFCILLAEMFVDWIKHAFITRFNELNLDVYRDYTTSLAYDVAQTRQKHAFSDHCDLVARRMGFIPLPLGVVTIRVLMHCVKIEDIGAVVIFILVFLFLTTLKIFNSLLILARACYLIEQHKTEKAAASLNSPTNYRSCSPLLTSPSRTDSAASPLRPPVMDQPTFRPHLVFQEVSVGKCDNGKIGSPIPTDLGPAAILHPNSNVDLQNATLNDQLLKIEGNDIKIEAVSEDVTKSFPDIKNEKGLPSESIIDETPKRSESEPNLNKVESES